MLEFEPNYLISSTKVPPKKNICTCNLLMTMWNVWAHEYLAILVGCQLFTAYWLSAIIWSRFVNETHEYLINSFIDHGGLTDSLCICTNEILLDR